MNSNGLINSLITRIPALKGCLIDSSGPDLLIVAPGQDACLELLKEAAALIQEAQLLAKCLIVKSQNETVFRWSFSDASAAIAPAISAPAPPLIAEMPDPPKPLAIVDMNTNQAIYITSAMQRIGGRACAPGEDTSRWHLPEELARLRTALEEHGFIREFEYKAFNLECQPIKNTINAWLIDDWRGSCVRVVELIDQELL